MNFPRQPQSTTIVITGHDWIDIVSDSDTIKRALERAGDTVDRSRQGEQMSITLHHYPRAVND